jgi:hypothetical protein
MKIVIMSGRALEDEIKSLFTEIQSAQPETEIQSLELLKKSFPSFHEVAIFVGESAGHLIVAILIEKGVKWATQVIRNGFTEPIVITIFGADGIPYARTKVLTSGEIEDVPVSKIPKMPPLPVHLL